MTASFVRRMRASRIDVSKMSKPHVTICGGFWERIRCPTAQRLCNREVGNSPRHHARHNPDYLRGKYTKDSRLVWRQVDRNKTRHLIEAAKPWLHTNSHPAKVTCRFSELPGARFNKPRGDLQTSIGHSSARIYIFRPLLWFQLNHNYLFSALYSRPCFS